MSVHFHLSKFLREGTAVSNVELSEVRQMEESIHSSKPTKLDLIISNLEPTKVSPLRRSGIVPR